MPIQPASYENSYFSIKKGNRFYSVPLFQATRAYRLQFLGPKSMK